MKSIFFKLYASKALVMLVTVASLLFSSCETEVTKTYTVTYDFNGGTISNELDADIVTVTAAAVDGKTLSKPAIRPRKDDYIIKGWYTTADAEGEPWSFESDTVNSDLTLYAGWLSLSELLITTQKENGLGVKIRDTGTIIQDLCQVMFSIHSWSNPESRNNTIIYSNTKYNTADLGAEIVYPFVEKNQQYSFTAWIVSYEWCEEYDVPASAVATASVGLGEWKPANSDEISFVINGTTSIRLSKEFNDPMLSQSGVEPVEYSFDFQGGPDDNYFCGSFPVPYGKASEERRFDSLVEYNKTAFNFSPDAENMAVYCFLKYSYEGTDFIQLIADGYISNPWH